MLQKEKKNILLHPILVLGFVRYVGQIIMLTVISYIKIMCLLPHFLFGHVCGKPYLVGNTSEICYYEMGEDYVENQSFELYFLLRGLINLFIQLCTVLGKKRILAARWRHRRVDEYK